MEAFALLSRGGLRFDKSKNKEQFNLFNSSAKASSSKSASASSQGLPAELDFFKYAQNSKGIPSSSKARGKRPEVSIPAVKEEMEIDAGDADATSEDEDEPNEAIEHPQYMMHRIAATGSRVPKSTEDFTSLPARYMVPQLIVDNLTNGGFVHPTAIQSQAIPILLEKRDLAGISPTGTGKTLAYLVPLFSTLGSPAGTRSKETDADSTGAKCPRALIICPTRELAGQIHNECMKLAQGRKWNILQLSKGGSSGDQKKMRGRVDIVIGNPLRLVSALREGTVKLNDVRFLVLDEADNLLDRSFIEQTEEVLEACTHPDLQKAIFSATLPAIAEQVAKRVLNDPIRVVVGQRNGASLHVSQALTYCGSESGKLFALRQLLATNPPLPMLVFVQAKERAKELYQELLYDNLTVDQLHSDMTSKQRLESVSRMRNGETWVMVCTDVMARGMDFGGIKGVVNYDFPTTVQSYVHRIGRTGRAGRTGVAISYFTDDDLPYLRPIAQMVHQVHIQQTAFANAAATNLDSETQANIVVSTTPVPEWMLRLSRTTNSRERKRLRTSGVDRKGVTDVAGGMIGKKDAIRKSQMIRSSKRRKESGKLGKHNGEKSRP